TTERRCSRGWRRRDAETRGSRTRSRSPRLERVLPAGSPVGPARRRRPWPMVRQATENRYTTPGDAAGDPRAPGHPRAWARTRTSGNASHDPAHPAVEPPPMSTLCSFLCWVHGAPCRPDFFNSPLRPAVTGAYSTQGPRRNRAETQGYLLTPGPPGEPVHAP